MCLSTPGEPTISFISPTRKAAVPVSFFLKNGVSSSEKQHKLVYRFSALFFNMKALSNTIFKMKSNRTKFDRDFILKMMPPPKKGEHLRGM